MVCIVLETMVHVVLVLQLCGLILNAGRLSPLFATPIFVQVGGRLSLARCRWQMVVDDGGSKGNGGSKRRWKRTVLDSESDVFACSVDTLILEQLRRRPRSEELGLVVVDKLDIVLKRSKSAHCLGDIAWGRECLTTYLVHSVLNMVKSKQCEGVVVQGGAHLHSVLDKVENGKVRQTSRDEAHVLGFATLLLEEHQLALELAPAAAHHVADSCLHGKDSAPPLHSPPPPSLMLSSFPASNFSGKAQCPKCGGVMLVANLEYHLLCQACGGPRVPILSWTSPLVVADDKGRQSLPVAIVDDKHTNSLFSLCGPRRCQWERLIPTRPQPPESRSWTLQLFSVHREENYLWVSFV